MNEFNNNYQNNDFSQNITPPTYTPPIFEQSDYSPASKPKKQKLGHSTATVILCCVLSAVIAVGGSFAAMWGTSRLIDDKDSTPQSATENTTINDTTPSNNAASININVDEDVKSAAEAVAKKCSNSVVGIRTTTSVNDFFGGIQGNGGEGSGVIYTADGYIITNYHVISNAVEQSGSKIDVFIGNSNSQSYPATVIGYNISCDLAVIKIEAENLTPVELADSSDLNIGQYVVTIGAPGGLEFMGSVTYGIISGLDRVVSTDSQLKLIQTDAAINPGNSGGALLNTQGELIGINSSKIAATEFEGMGFAIPSNAVKEKCDKIIARKGENGVYFGVSISKTYTSQVLAFYGYPTGAVVSTVSEGSPADKAGIERGDIITEFNGVKITEYTVLSDAIYDCESGDTVNVKLYRNGKQYTVKVKLSSVGA